MKHVTCYSRLARATLALGAALVAAALLAGTGAAMQRTAAPPSLSTLTKGVYGALPTTAPAPTKKTVWVVSCGQASIGCALETGGAMAAGRAIGWTMKRCDGKFDTNDAWGTCYRQAIAAHANGIVGIGIGCAAVKQPLQEAKAAGVKTISSHDFDCSDPYYGGGKPLFSTQIVYSPQFRSAAAYWTALGRAEASYFIAKRNGKAKIIELVFPEVIYTRYLDKGLRQGLASCKGCSIVDQLNLSVQDQATNQVPPKFSAVLLKHPEANAVAVPFDSLFAFGLKQAIVSSGRASQLAVLGGFGEPEVVPFIRANRGVNAVIGTPIVWFGWASIDELNRAFAGKPPVSQGLGFQLMDSTHNLPSAKGQGYTPPIKFQQAYKAAWGRG